MRVPRGKSGSTTLSMDEVVCPVRRLTLVSVRLRRATPSESTEAKEMLGRSGVPPTL